MQAQTFFSGAFDEGVEVMGADEAAFALKHFNGVLVTKVPDEVDFGAALREPVVVLVFKAQPQHPRGDGRVGGRLLARRTLPRKNP